jgi:hypothetical protein
MDLALTVFRVGVGVGALLVGIGVIVAILSLRPLIRDSRALARDALRVVRLTETELAGIVAHAREVTANAEEMSEDISQALARIGAVADAFEQRGRPILGPVQSADAREDERIA